MRRLTLFVVGLAAALALMPGAAIADPNNEAATFELHIEVPNVAQASSGDRIAITGMGTFSVHPKSVTASGGFVHTTSTGMLVGSGTWTATDLLSFEFYGCGVVKGIGATLPANFCGGVLKLRVVFTPSGTSLAIPGSSRSSALSVRRLRRRTTIRRSPAKRASTRSSRAWRTSTESSVA